MAAEWTRVGLNNLIRILANIYPTGADSLAFVRRVGFQTMLMSFDGTPIANWTNIVENANRRTGGVNKIVDLALSENPGDEALLSAKDHSPPPPIDEPELTDWNAFAGGPGKFEKIIGDKSTLVSVSSLELGLLRSKSVVRVKRKDGSSGSGFVVSDNILITNNHVIPNREVANESVIQFNYQKTVEGLDGQVEEFKLDNSYFKTSPEGVDDWTAVKFKGNADKWGKLALRDVQVKVGDFVNIVQHPGGGQKQISFAPNLVTFVGEGRVQYLTDTMPGL